MSIPAGRAASHTWRALPAEVRERAIALGRIWQPYPYPDIQRVIVGHLVRWAAWQRSFAYTMGLLPVVLFINTWGWATSGTVALLVILTALAVFAVVAAVALRQSRLRYLGPPNVAAVGVAATAPTEPVTIRRTADSVVLCAFVIAIPLVSLLPGMLGALRDYEDRSGIAERVMPITFATIYGTLIAAWLTVVIGLIAFGAGPFGRRRVGTMDAVGIHIRHLGLTVPWQDIRKVSGTGEDGVTGLAIWLIDPARTMATSDLSPWRRKLLFRATRRSGWLRLPAAPTYAPSGLTVVSAIALHLAAIDNSRRPELGKSRPSDPAGEMR